MIMNARSCLFMLHFNHEESKNNIKNSYLANLKVIATNQHNNYQLLNFNRILDNYTTEYLPQLYPLTKSDFLLGLQDIVYNLLWH